MKDICALARPIMQSMPDETSCVAPLSARVNVTSTNVTSPGWKFAARDRTRGGSAGQVGRPQDLARRSHSRTRAGCPTVRVMRVMRVILPVAAEAGGFCGAGDAGDAGV